MSEPNPNPSQGATVRIAGLDPIEAQLAAKGAGAGRRVTHEQVAAAIVGEYFFTGLNGVNGSGLDLREEIHVGPLERLVFCVLVLDNGFTVTGQTSKADPVGWDLEIGKAIARQDAVRQAWQYLGFRLYDDMMRGTIALDVRGEVA